MAITPTATQAAVRDGVKAAVLRPLGAAFAPGQDVGVVLLGADEDHWAGAGRHRQRHAQKRDQTVDPRRGAGATAGITAQSSPAVTMRPISARAALRMPVIRRPRKEAPFIRCATLSSPYTKQGNHTLLMVYILCKDKH